MNIKPFIASHFFVSFLIALTTFVHPAFAQQTENNSATTAEKTYFNALTQDQVNENFKRIDTGGIISAIRSVPNQREINGGHVSDPHTILSPEANQLINDLLTQLEDSAGYQVAVVCLYSIGANDPHTWGTDLFNRWGIGDQKTDDGLLLLLVIDQRKIEFITGRGTEGILTDGDCYDIQQTEMVPYFKQDDYVTGMIRGTQAICDFLYGSPPIYTSDETPIQEDYNVPVTEEKATEESFSIWKSAVFIWYATAVVILTSGWMLILLITFFMRDLHKRYHTIKFFTLKIWMFLFPVPFVLIYFATKGIMNRWRNTIRFSEKTGEEMHKLGDHEEDKHLSKGQISEEKVKSIDHDVWITYGGNEILILSYKKWFSKHVKCPSCSFKTYFKLYDKTIDEATFESSGTGEKCHQCENCNHTVTEQYTIAQKSRPSSSDADGSSGSSGGSSSGNSGGSSYDGGSSRGGGAGSSW